MRLRTCITIALLAAWLAPARAPAQDWPNRPLRFLTGFATGGSSDQLARIVAERLSTTLGQPAVVDNRSGGNGVAGTALAAKAPADGYNYLVVFDAHSTNPSLQKQLPYDTLRDFASIMLFASSPFGFVVNPAAPYRNLADLIAAAKTKPGDVTLGTSGVGSRGHLAFSLLASRAGFRFTQVSYRGPSQAITDVLGGQITLQAGTVFFVAPFVRSQRVRALALTSAARMPQLPDIPTVAEQGFPGYEVISWWGIVAPAGIPKDIMQKMHAALLQVMAAPDIRSRLEQLGMTVIASTPEAFAKHLAAEMALWGKVVRESNIVAGS
ncbi:MAG: tripartite tricarboxylate transporter substrate binding protein [Burkholderiales bacterium]|nr:tripartite tricarboxylate transporter substrate binding protein [Burkholderiales bacterium]